MQVSETCLTGFGSQIVYLTGLDWLWEREPIISRGRSNMQGNYPYPSTYILNGVGLLPAFPMRVACSHLEEKDPSDTALLHGLAAAAGVFYNYSHDVPCFNYRFTPIQCSPCAAWKLSAMTSRSRQLLLRCSQGANEETDQDGLFWDYQ